MRLFCAAAANIAERISIFGRIRLLMPSARLFFFLFTHAKKCVCQYACVFLSCVCIFTCAYPLFRWCACMRKVFLGSSHCFSPLYSRVHSRFLRYWKDAELFLCVLCPRVIRVWSRRVNFWRNFLKNSQIFCLDPPGNPCSLLFCRFLCIFAPRRW